MATAYVFSPFTGWISGRDNYCCNSGDPNNQSTCSDPCLGTCGYHPPTQSGFTSPIDVNAPTDTEIRLYVNWTTVKSVIIRDNASPVCAPGVSDPWNDGRAVELYCYNDGHGLIGKVFYGHVNNPISNLNQVITQPGSGYVVIGRVPGPCGGCGTSCYPKTHVHMARSGGSTGSGCCCCGTVYGASTVLYSWSFLCPV